MMNINKMAIHVMVTVVVSIGCHTRTVKADQEALNISAFKDISAFILETGKAEHLISANIKYVKDSEEAHSDLINQQADVVFMSYDDTLSLALEDNYSDIVAAMPIHGGMLNLCGKIST